MDSFLWESYKRAKKNTIRFRQMLTIDSVHAVTNECIVSFVVTGIIVVIHETDLKFVCTSDPQIEPKIYVN